MEILGIKITEVTKEQTLKTVIDFLDSSGQKKIFTPNPEMIVKAQKDTYFKEVLNFGDLNLCDGMGLWLATRLSFRPKRSEVEKSPSPQSLRDPSTPARFAGASARRVGMTIERISGADFMVEICRLAAEQGKTVYLLGSGFDEVVKKTAENLQAKFPNLKIVGMDKGPNIDEFKSIGLKINKEEHDALIQKINTAKPDILFVAFGMGKQEKWIHENLVHLPSVKISMGVGGSFDFISGKIKRAPLFLQRLGLEWAYRLWQEPARIERIFNATVLFIYYYVRS